MKLHSFLRHIGLLFFVAQGPSLRGAAAPAIAPEQREFFENKIRPILSETCLECHSAEKGKVKGGLNLDSRETLLKGGETGPGFKIGDVKGSLLIKAITWEDDLQMPPKKKLTPDQIADLKTWIGMGAPDPRDPSKLVVKDKKSHWAFQPVTRPKVPEVKNAAWCQNSIDNFVLAKLESKEMLPAAQADKEALLRRAYFDLIGLPPSPSQIESFVRNPEPEKAYERVIDKLLSDTAYGERWARHWMDTARYADTTGLPTNNGSDYRYAYAYSYRDWLINAINADMPYDKFILHQLAADRLASNGKENLAALGFLTVGQRFGPKDDVINDRIDVVGRGFLGLTIACARCHDHKFDPVTAADYYALRGVFNSIAEPKEGPIIAGDRDSKYYQEFSRKLGVMEQNVIDTLFAIQREISGRLRKNAEAVFEIGYLSRRDASQEERTAATEMLTKARLQANFVDQTAKINPNHPVTGIFVKMITLQENRGPQLAQIFEGASRGSRYNPEVIAFLKKQPKLPSSVHEVAVLFGRMMLELEPLVAGLFAEITDTTKNAADSPKKALMELATHPFNMVPMFGISMQKAVEEGARLGQDFSREFERRAALPKINEFKLRAKGGPVRAMVVEDLPRAQDSELFVRGNAPKAGEEARIIPRRFIEVLSPNGEAIPFKEGSGRLELAQAIASKQNPLTARVLANRVWMYHFGEGLVRTPDDLGNQAGQPSHPELLDFLASWFTEDFGATKPGWSMKALHKAIMMSKTYQQSSNTPFRGKSINYEKLDPANSLLWHANVRRLDFESFRDSLLSMAGTLDRSEIGGPSVNITLEPYSFRRSVYGYIDRANIPDLLMQFDVANPDQPNTKRTSTIVPQQALFLMNSSFAAQVVQKIVNRPEVVQAVSVEKNTKAGIVAIFRIILQRTPTVQEQEMALQFLLKEKSAQDSVKSATVEIAREALKRAGDQLKAEQKNERATKAIINDGEFNGPNVTITNGSPLVSHVTNTAELHEGAVVSGPGVPEGTVIKSVMETMVTLSKPVTTSSNSAKLRAADLVQRKTFSPWEALVQAIIFSNEAAYVN